VVAKFRAHRNYYIVLAGMQISGFILVLFAHSDKQLVFSYVIISTLFYILWAYIHHFIHHSLNAKIVLEYIVMGVLGIAVMFFFLR